MNPHDPAVGWEPLLARATELGFTVELVEYCESTDSPGLLGAGLGVCLYGKRIIRVRQALREDDRCFVLAHELDHAQTDVEGGGREAQAELDRRFSSQERERHEAIGEYLYPRP